MIGKTLKVYVDDMLTKSLKARNHVADLKKTFDVLRTYKIKLNSTKYVFRVGFGKFLGFMVNHLGMKANPAKIKGSIEMKSLGKIKEIPRLTRMIATLTRFISRSTDKCRPFFQALKKGREMKWTEECEEEFQNTKRYLGNPRCCQSPRKTRTSISPSRGMQSAPFLLKRRTQSNDWSITSENPYKA